MRGTGWYGNAANNKFMDYFYFLIIWLSNI